MTVSENSERVAAFFDVDGTLLAGPSLERVFFEDLRARGAIAWRNYLLWLAQAGWLAPRGIQMMRHANKMYLRGVSVDGGETERKRETTPEQRRRVGPRFFPDGVDQVAWHARQGHAIVLVSGALAPLTKEIALALVIRLAVRGMAAAVEVRATEVEERGGRWTGRIAGEAMFGEAKARAVRELAKERGFEPGRCYAYGNSRSDLAMLEAVGRAVVVNPSARMEALARRRGWAVMAWLEKELTQSSTRAQRIQRRDETLLGPENAA